MRPATSLTMRSMYAEMALFTSMVEAGGDAMGRSMGERDDRRRGSACLVLPQRLMARIARFYQIYNTGEKKLIGGRARKGASDSPVVVQITNAHTRRPSTGDANVQGYQEEGDGYDEANAVPPCA